MFTLSRCLSYPYLGRCGAAAKDRTRATLALATWLMAFPTTERDCTTNIHSRFDESRAQASYSTQIIGVASLGLADIRYCLSLERSVFDVTESSQFLDCFGLG